MYKYAYEITGYGLSNEDFTKMAFEVIVRKNPGISLDKAILCFEKAPDNISLEKFAEEKHRTAVGYRNVYRKYFE